MSILSLFSSRTFLLRPGFTSTTCTFWRQFRRSFVADGKGSSDSEVDLCLCLSVAIQSRDFESERSLSINR